MRDDKSWELFFQTGLPQAYLWIKHRQKDPKDESSKPNRRET